MNTSLERRLFLQNNIFIQRIQNNKYTTICKNLLRKNINIIPDFSFGKTRKYNGKCDEDSELEIIRYDLKQTKDSCGVNCISIFLMYSFPFFQFY